MTTSYSHTTCCSEGFYGRAAKLAAYLSCCLLLAFSAVSVLGEVVINEIMYHPYENWKTNSSGSWILITNKTEYVELYNPGTNTVDLSSYRFDNGITFDFPAGTTLSTGAYLVVCEDVVAFSNAYRTITNITRIGNYNGSLKNGGERLTLSRLVNDQWVTVQTIGYTGFGPSDGDGSSLELVNPGFAPIENQFYGAWADSTNAAISTNNVRYGGTPGRANSVYDPMAPPVIGDVRHDPPVPPAGSSVTISCRVGARVSGMIYDTKVYWRWDANPTNVYQELEMFDNGYNGDVTAGDGIYSRAVPPYGSLPPTNGQLLEFRIQATDLWAVASAVYPPESRSGVAVTDLPSKQYSYLCCFGEDTGFTGEYPTYHILMTQVAKTQLWAQTGSGSTSDTYKMLDGTLITSDGKIFYNSAFKQRCSTRVPPYSYSVALPAGETHDGYNQVDFNYQNQFNNFLGYKITARAGNPASQVALMRLWMNGTYLTPGNPKSDTLGQYMYLRVERPVDVARRLYPGDYGNEYKADGDGYRVGDLSHWDTLAEYRQTGTAGHGYGCNTGNPVTAWADLSNLTYVLNLPAAQLAVQVTNWVSDVHDWARLFAVNTAINNSEPGMLRPAGVAGDEMRIYGDQTMRFSWWPWDFSDVLLVGSANARIPWGFSGGVQGTVRNFLFNPPMVYFYAGDVLTVLNDVMSTSNMNVMIDQMGTGATNTNPGYNWRTTYQSNADTLRSDLVPHFKTNLTVAVSNAVYQGNLAAVVTNATLRLSGQLPQDYTASLLINGIPAAWNTWTNADMENTYGKWRTTNSIILSAGVNSIPIKTLDYYGNVLIATNLTVILRTNTASETGDIATPVIWSNNITHRVSGTVTVQPGGSLTVLAGTVIMFDSGQKIVASGGPLLLQGTTNSFVYLYPYDGTSAWSVEANGSSISGAFVRASGGRVVVGAGGQVNLDDSRIGENRDAVGIVSAADSSLVQLRRCIVSDFEKTSFSNTTVQVEDSLFRNFSDCGMLFGGSTVVVSRTSVTNSMNAGVDGIRFQAGAAGMITNCAISRMSGNGVRIGSSAAGVSVCYSLLNNCSTGLLVETATAATNFNNTIAGCGVGLAGAQSVTWNTICWSNTVSVTNGAAVTYSDIEQPWDGLYAGVSNINRNPWFKDAREGDYRLQGISPCLAGGSDGAYMGALFPAGATPMWPSNLTAAVMTVPTNGIHLAWQDNSGDEQSFKIERSLDGMTWSWLTNVVANSNGYNDVLISQNTLYYYRVKAWHERGESLPSEEVAATTAFGAMMQYLTNYLRMTEIMYNPLTSGNDEFLEFKNIGGVTLNLSGLTFSNGVTYDFPATNLTAGGFYVIVKDPVSYTNRYPGRSYNGVFSGGLDNGGERLRIKDAGGNTIIDVTYNDAWYPTTDGGGYSLVPVTPNQSIGNPDLPEYWRPSSTNGGSPGADDISAAYGIVISEVLSHSHGETPDVGDWIELYNTTTNSINIQNWFISHSATNLTAFRITNSVIIPPHGFTNFTEYNHFGTNVLGLAKGFAFSEMGDSAYLSSGGASTNLTSYRTSVDFGPAERSTSFGRYTRSDGVVDFTSMSDLTRNASNAYPKVGPVVISEIMYNPSAGGKEYVELHNITSSNIPLFDLQFGQPTNTWKLTGGLEYVFPTNTWINTNEYILIVGVAADEFRMTTGLTNPAVRIFGPGSGQLGNGGDVVRLKKPVAQDTHFEVPYVLIDEVDYGDNTPWPTLADNGGASLERVNCTAYGNDPTNWVGASLGGTPGLPNNTNGTPTVSFLILHDSGYESNTTVSIAVSMYPSPTDTVTVAYGVVGGTASQGVDYALSPGTLVFWPNDTVKHIPLQVIKDSSAESNETVIVGLTNVSANARLGGNTVFEWTIIDTSTTVIAVPVITPSVSTNYFTNMVLVSISSSVSGSEIFYTTDGSIPTRNDHLYSSPLALTHSTRLTARTYLGSLQCSASTSTLFVANAGALVTNGMDHTVIRVCQTNDDAIQTSTIGGSFVSLDDQTLPLGRKETTGPWYTGMRFTGIALEKNAIVTNAYIQFTGANETFSNTAVVIMGQRTNNAAAFVAATRNISQRSNTAARVTWELNQWWGPTNFPGASQRTPNLAGIVNEIVAQSNWVSGNSIVFIMTNRFLANNTLRMAYSYDGDPSNAPALHIWYPSGNYWLGVVTNGNGSISGGNVWAVIGSTNTIVAATNPHSMFVGWSGDVDGCGDTNNPSLLVPMTKARTITGNFAVSEYWLEVTTNGLGIIEGGNAWMKASSNAVVQATTNLHYYFAGWSGAVDGIAPDTNSASITLPMTNNRSIVGFFNPILWAHDTPEWWLDIYYPGTNDYNNAAILDTDGDGHVAWKEYIAGTDPTNFLSVLAVSGITNSMAGSQIFWPTVTGRTYSVYKTTNLLEGWLGAPLTNGVPGSSADTNYLDADTSTPAAFYDVRVQQAP